MKIKLPAALTISAILLQAAGLSAHGITAAKRIDKAVIVDIRYDDGEPFSYSEVKIYAPGKDKVEYIKSRTDAGGTIAFVPNAAGTWRISATDDMSHGKELNIHVSGEDLSSDSNKAWSDARRHKITTAFLLVWAAVSTFLYIGARRKAAKIKQ
jgi:hypothetical protein